LLLAKVRTAKPGKPAAGIASVKVALNHLLDNGPEEAILLLEASFVLGQEPIGAVEQHPIK
jgi:hypothetical protein